MKLHTHLTGPDIGSALIRAKKAGLITWDVDFAVFEHGPSMTHPHSFEIQLGTHDQHSLPAGYTDQHGRNLRVRRIRGGNHGDARWAATWHEWGWLIAEIFAADPQARWGTNPARSHHPQGYCGPEDFHVKTGGQFRTRPAESGAQIMPTTLKAYREDGTEVRPGDTINMGGIDTSFTFRAAIVASNDNGTDGMISVNAPDRDYPDMYASPFGLTVRDVPADDEPAWRSTDTGLPDDIQRDIRGPGGFRAAAGPDYAGQWSWVIIDTSDGAGVASGKAADQAAARQAVTDWEREHGLIPEDRAPGTVFPDLDSILGTGSSDRSEPEPVPDVAGALAKVTAAQKDPETWATSTELAALRDLAVAVGAQLAKASDAGELAAQADRIARTTAPPVPGITQNTGHTVYAVLGHQPASPGSLESWIVAAADDRGEHVTWTAYASDDGSGRLHYDGGHYFSPGHSAASDALADLADRAKVFSRLTELNSGVLTRTAFQDSHAKVLDELAGTWGVGRAKVRAGLLEAAALGYARISWTTDGTRKDYGIRYDRYRCTFSWDREH